MKKIIYKIREIIKSNMDDIFSDIKNSDFISDEGSIHKIDYGNGEEYAYTNYILIAEEDKVYRIFYRIHINGMRMK